MSREKKDSKPGQDVFLTNFWEYTSSTSDTSEDESEAMVTLPSIPNGITPQTHTERVKEQELLRKIMNSPVGSIKRFKLLKKNAFFQLARGYISTAQGNCDKAMDIDSEDPDIFMLYGLIENAKARREIIMNNEGSMRDYFGKARNFFNKFKYLYNRLVESSGGINKIVNYGVLGKEDRSSLYFMGLASTYAGIGDLGMALYLYGNAGEALNGKHMSEDFQTIYKQNRYIVDFFLEKLEIKDLERKKNEAQDVAVDLAKNVGPSLEETRNYSRIAAEASRDAAYSSRQAAYTSGINAGLIDEFIDRTGIDHEIESARLALSARLKEMKEKAFNLGDSVISVLGLAGAGVLLAAECIETHDDNTPKNHLKTASATAVFLALMVKAGPEAFRQSYAAGSFVARLCNSGYQRLQQHL